jgi:hypothetical protein
VIGRRSAAAAAAVAAAAVATLATAAAASPAWSVSARSVHHGEAVPLAAIGDEDEALRRLDPRSGRNIAYVDDEVRMSLDTGAWRWSVLARGSAVLVTTRDTLELVKQINSDATPATDRQWQTRLRYESFQGGGLEVGYRFEPAAQWQASLSAQVLQLRHWRQRRLEGPVSFEAASATYAFDLQSAHADDRLRFPFQGAQGDTGAGALLGGEVGWRGEAWSASLGVRDLGWLRWRQLPQQYATLSTQTQSYDADGFVIYRPLVMGRNSQEGYTHRLRGVWSARAAWRAGTTGTLELGGDWVHDFGVLPAVAWRQRLGAVDAGLQWHVHERRATVSLGWQGWWLRAGADRLGSQQRSRELALGGGWVF